MNPVEAFVKALVAKWYIIVVVAAFSVLYSTYTALRDKGVIAKAEAMLIDATSQIKGAAQNCMPLITDLNQFWKCLGEPNRYAPTQEDTDLENSLKNRMQGVLENDSNNAGTQSNTNGIPRLPSSGISNTNTQNAPASTDTSSSSSTTPPIILP
ncbi:DUF2670 domain-containing protein [Candidatus Phycorickettsia trachydisci]|nr:DUF2670 domain-containing protein [Candidatus Phycorickettsia trachydisci]